MPQAIVPADLSDLSRGLDTLAFRLDRRLPVSEQVYDALRKAIVCGQLRPGASISENSIGRRFGVSRTPIRAALQRLSEEGMIDVFPQQGSFVAPINLPDIKNSHFVRRSLEVAVLKEAVQLWSAEKSKIARQAIAQHAATVVAGDVEAFHEEDERFHQLLTVFADREGVWSTVLSARTKLTRFIRLFGKPERLPVVIEEHTAIIDALDEGNGQKAEAALVYHLDKVFSLLEELPEQDKQYFVD